MKKVKRRPINSWLISDDQRSQKGFIKVSFALNSWKILNDLRNIWHKSPFFIWFYQLAANKFNHISSFHHVCLWSNSWLLNMILNLLTRTIGKTHCMTNKDTFLLHTSSSFTTILLSPAKVCNFVIPQLLLSSN